MLGMALRGSERFAEAGQAFRRATELAPGNADYTAYLGEMLILAADGPPPPEAERLFRRALELQPGNPQARYYLATLRDMRGDHRGAVDDLVALLREAPAGATWEPQVRGAVTAIARRQQYRHRRPAARPRPPRPPGPPPPPPSPARRRSRWQRRGRSRRASRTRWCATWSTGSPRACAATRATRRLDHADALAHGAAAIRARRARRSAPPSPPSDDAAAQGRLRQAARELAVPNPS